MKKFYKRIVAILCAMIMIVGSVMPGNGQIVRASDVHEWPVFEGSQQLVGSAGSIRYENNSINCQVPTTVDYENLALYMKINIQDSNTIRALQLCYVELTQGGTCDQQELQWDLLNEELTVGENEIYLDFSDARNRNGTENVPFEMGKTVNYFRIFQSGEMAATSAVLTELKLVDVTEAGLEFGETDTYLQLENELTTAPETIEASVKMEEPQKEWTVVSIDKIVNGNPQVGTTAEGEAPGTGVGYVDLTINAGTVIVTGTGDGIKLEAPDFGKYTKDDLTLAFWYYADETGTLPAGQIELASYKDRADTQEIFWNTSNISVEQGWNYIQLPLSNPNGNADGNADVVGAENKKAFDFSNLVRVRWYTTYSDTTQAWNFKLTDMKIVAQEPEEATEWTLMSTDKFHTSSTKGVTGENEAPGTGVDYASFSITSGLSYIVSNTTFEPLDLQMNTQEHLALAFWIKADNAGYLPTGEIELGNDADTEGVQIFWRTDNIYVEAGWNYIELPFHTSYYSSMSDLFDASNLMRVRWYFNDNTVGLSWNISVTDLQVVITEGAEWRIAKTNSIGTEIRAEDREVGGPDASWNVSEINVQKQILFSQSFETPDFSEYTQDDLVLAFWYYSYAEEEVALPAGELELSSATSSTDTYEIRWNPSNFNVKPGWNYIELPLNCFDGQGGSFDLSNLCYVRIHGYKDSNGSYPTWKFKLSDMKIIAKEAPLTRWVMNQRAISTNYNYTTHTYPSTFEDNGAQQLFVTSMQTLLDFENYTKEDLSVAFWYYSNKEGTLPNGWFEISSGGKADTESIQWPISGKQVNQGWNYITFPLKDAVKRGSGEFELSGLNYMRWCINRNSLDAEWNFKMSPTIEVVAKSKTSASKIAIKENIDTSTLNEYMIFSNLNADDSNSYALFLTKEGYPALLWGNTQFTLNQSVFTGEWVDIAAVHNEDKTISFYIDGVLAATSDKTVDALGEFTTAHCIGADGSGGQLMKGKIADVRLWSDARTEEEIKNNLEEKQYVTANSKLSADTEGLIDNWFLYGDIQYILTPMTSIKGNALVYCGTRADDWYDYDISEHDFLWQDKNDNGTLDDGEENYWSLVFIPDIQNLTVASPKYQEVWLKAAQWIADNVETEGIKHVIGAGDTTWDNATYQYDNAMEGIELFDSEVPFSNLIGNHDYVWNATYRDSSLYQTYFGQTYVEDESKAISEIEYGYFADERTDSSSSNTVTSTENSYYRFTVNNTPWMILQLEYHPRMSAIQWADEILKKYPNDNVILATHGYIDGYGEYIGEGMQYLNNNVTGDGSDYIDSTGVIWEELQDNTNIKLILCGHSTNDTGSIAVREETNSEGRTVKALMINAQDLDASESRSRDTSYYSNRPVGMLGILRFSEDGEHVAVQYYSPTDGKSFNPLDTATSTERTTKDLTLEYGVEPYIVEYKNGATAGQLPQDVEDKKAEGYAFAGWYTDANCTKVLSGTVSNKAVYAKYVDADALTVQAQAKYTENSNNTKLDLRFVTTVDSLEYKEVGFIVTNRAGTELKYQEEYVYKELSAAGVSYAPYERFCLQSMRFATIQMINVPISGDGISADREIPVQAYWITKDGSFVYGEKRGVKVSDAVKSATVAASLESGE